MVDTKHRQELGSHLEDEMQPNGLVADWAAVKKAYNSRLDKRPQWRVHNRAGGWRLQ